jgi:hypothetical protein
MTSATIKKSASGFHPSLPEFQSLTQVRGTESSLLARIKLQPKARSQQQAAATKTTSLSSSPCKVRNPLLPRSA